VTIEIPEPLYRQAQQLASAEGATVEEIILGALEKDLSTPDSQPGLEGDRHFDIDELGLPRLRRSKNDSTQSPKNFSINCASKKGSDPARNPQQ